MNDFSGLWMCSLTGFVVVFRQKGPFKANHLKLSDFSNFSRFNPKVVESTSEYANLHNAVTHLSGQWF